VAELLDALLRAAGVDTTVPIRILDGLSGLCDPDTTSASVVVLMRSLVDWVTDAIANAAAERTQARIHMLGSVIYYAVLRTLLWGYGIRASTHGKVRFAVDGETFPMSGPQAASLSWAGPIIGNYSDGCDGFFDLPRLVAHHAGKMGAVEKLLGLLDRWREVCDGIVETHVTVPEAAAVVGAVLDQLAVRRTHPEFGSQVSGARRKILAFSAAEQRPDSGPAIAFRAVLAILVAIDAAFRCNLAVMAARAFEGPHALMPVSVFLPQLHVRTAAMTLSRKHPLRLLFADDAVLAAGLELYCIEVGPCITWYWYRYWCTPVLFAIGDAGTAGYVPFVAKSAINHQVRLSPAPPKRPLSAALRAAMVAANGLFVQGLRLQLRLQTLAFPPGVARGGEAGNPPYYAERGLAPWEPAV
jgi:hypothetical protein